MTEPERFLRIEALWDFEPEVLVEEDASVDCYTSDQIGASH
jgi:hypothetical protein